jgi:hypothetical protein
VAPTGASTVEAGMRICVINLDRSVQRMFQFRRENAHMPEIERFPAIDGGRIDRSELDRANTIAIDVPYTSGAVG